MTQRLNNIAEIIDGYDGFIIDQWGVLHNGVAPFDGAIAALSLIKQQGKIAIILSNSGKRADYNQEKMAALGLTPDLYNHILTSGEACHQDLAHRIEAGASVVLISRDDDASVIEGLDFQITKDINIAKAIIIAGNQAHFGEPKDLYPIIEQAAKLDLPCYCANPDIYAVIGQERYYTAGFLAKKYEEFGGKVFYYGKPFAPVYAHCLTLLHDIPRHRVLAIGDSLDHDVKGGQDFGAHTLFIENGVHRTDIAEHGHDALYEKYNIRPDYIMHEWR